MKHESKCRRSLLVVLALASWLVAVGGAASAPAAERPLRKISFLLPFLRSIAFYPVHLAEELGYFKQEGLNITSEAASGSSFVIQQVAAGRADFGIATADPILLGFAQSPDYRVVYDYLTGNVFDLFSLEASGIKRLSDLRGRTIGVKDMTGGEIPGLRVRLEKAGLALGADVQILAVGESPASQAEALRSGRIDAFLVSWNSAVGVRLALKNEGAELACLTCGSTLSPASEAVVVSEKLLASERELVVGVGRALAKATLFARTNPRAAKAIMKKVRPEEHEDAVFAAAYFDAALEITRPRQGAFGLLDPAAWHRSMEQLLLPGSETGLERPVDLSRLIDNSLVDEYNRFDHDAVVRQARDFRVF